MLREKNAGFLFIRGHGPLYRAVFLIFFAVRQMIAQTASQIMELALDNYVIDRNPARKLKPPADSLEAEMRAV